MGGVVSIGTTHLPRQLVASAGGRRPRGLQEYRGFAIVVGPLDRPLGPLFIGAVLAGNCGVWMFAGLHNDSQLIACKANRNHVRTKGPPLCADEQGREKTEDR